jgi:hypothetical protein
MFFVFPIVLHCIVHSLEFSRLIYCLDNFYGGHAFCCIAIFKVSLLVFNSHVLRYRMKQRSLFQEKHKTEEASMNYR